MRSMSKTKCSVLLSLQLQVPLAARPHNAGPSLQVGLHTCICQSELGYVSSATQFSMSASGHYLPTFRHLLFTVNVQFQFEDPVLFLSR